MKRVFLPTPELLRTAAVMLVLFAVNGDMGRNVGDPVHEWVTEGRRREWERAHARGDAWAQGTPYSSCGDLAHWLLMMLGCRNERYVNRTGDCGEVPWKATVNITRLVALPAYQPAKSAAGRTPQSGDILHVAGPDHVAVVDEWNEATGEVTSADYGQPYGRRRKHPIVRRRSTILVGTRVLMGWVDLEQVVLEESALVPEDFEGGEEDLNPYNAELTIPPGVA